MASYIGYPIEVVLVDNQGRRLFADALVPGTVLGSLAVDTEKLNRLVSSAEMRLEWGDNGDPPPPVGYRVEEAPAPAPAPETPA